MTAQAQFVFSNNDGSLMVEGYNGPDTDIVIPGTNGGLIVTSIDEDAFAGANLTSVVIPGTITNIGASAFLECSSLTNVTISEGVTSIDLGAFLFCTALTSVTFPNSLNNFGDSVFLDSGLTTVTIPGGVTNTGNSTFAGCVSLTNVIIAPGITSLGGGMFQSCSSLVNVSLPATVTNIGSQAFYGCTNLNGLYFGGCTPGLGFEALPPVTNSPLATCYYLPAATGWATTFDGLPTQVWNPQMQSPGNLFGAQSNCFGFHISASTNLTVVVEACDGFTDPFWQTLQTITLTNGTACFYDPQFTNYAGRFYRLRVP